MNSKPGHLSNRRILVVDDDEISRLVAGEILGSLGAEVDLAAQPEDAVAMAGAVRYDLIVLDLHMPAMNGAELAAVLGRLDRTLEERIVLLTGGEPDESPEHDRAEYPWPVYAKPLDPALILNRFPEAPELDRAPGGSEGVHPDIHGLDMAAGMGNFMGNEQALFLTLQALPAYSEQLIADFEACLRQRDSRECRRLAHSLKGSSAMIGAVRIHDLARRLESSCVMSSDISEVETLFRDIRSELMQTSESIRRCPILEKTPPRAVRKP